MKVFVMLSAATLLLLAHPAAFALDPSLWRQWSPRSEIAPRFSDEKNGDRTGQGPALEIQTTTETEFGAWQHDFDQVEPGHNYRFTAWYRATNIPEERRSVIARLEWRNSKGNPVRPPEYALDVARSGDWTRVELSTPAPTNAASVNVQLSVAFAPNATLWWDDVQLTHSLPHPPYRQSRHHLRSSQEHQIRRRKRRGILQNRSSN